MIARQTKPLG